MLDRWRARWPWLDAVLRVNERFSVIGGGPLSASIALSGFLSLFPLLLVVVAILGFLAAGDTGFAGTLVRDLGLRGRASETVLDAIETAERSRRTASIVGVAGLVWSGLGVVGSLQTGINAAWQVTGRGLLDRLVALRWLLGAGMLFLTSLSLGPLMNLLPGALAPLTILVGLLLSTVLFVWTFHSLGNAHLGWRAHLPGAVLVAVGFEILKVLGAVYVPRAVASSSALYGSLGVVFAVLAWLLVYARLIMYGAVLNVVRYEAAAGTVTAEIQVPRIPGEVPLEVNRGGAVSDMADAEGPDR